MVSKKMTIALGVAALFASYGYERSKSERPKQNGAAAQQKLMAAETKRKARAQKQLQKMGRGRGR